MKFDALDNPIWNALISHNSRLAKGNNEVKYFGDDVAPFIGMPEYDKDSMQKLYAEAPKGRKLVLFSSKPVEFPEGLTVEEYIETYQMVNKSIFLPDKIEMDIRDLSRKDVPEMLKLTEETDPGPFFENTIEFGHYQGIFEKDRLVSMAGYRLRPLNFTEISAVCTAKDCQGKGYAGAILNRQIISILDTGHKPFLHVKTNNERAISRYEKSRFSIRRIVHIYIFHK